MAYLGRGIENLSDRVVLDSLTASATASYTLQLNSANFVPSSAESLTVSLNGVIQAPISSYTVSGSTLTFASALTSSDSIDFIIAERGITLQTPSAGSVGTSQLASTAVTPAKMDLSQDYTFTGKVSGHNYPAFEAYMSSSQNLSDASETKVQFDTERFDTNSMYDASTNYRWTPTVAGKYLIYAQVGGDSSGGTQVARSDVMIYKNGSSYARNRMNLATSDQIMSNIEAVIDFNGSSDYVEIYAYIDVTAGTPFVRAGTAESRFGAYRIGD